MSPFIIPIVALLIPMIIVPVVLGLRHAKLDRELEHAERMRALEMGRTLPQDEAWWTPARISVTIGAGVPIGVFLCAVMAIGLVGYREGIWVGAMAVGVTAVVCGTFLAAKSFNSRAFDPVKPMMDADVFDVAGSRG